jgi:hypothetical protein
LGVLEVIEHEHGSFGAGDLGEVGVRKGCGDERDALVIDRAQPLVEF